MLAQDYARTARAKGLAEPAVIGRHVLRNAIIPILAVIGLNIGTPHTPIPAGGVEWHHALPPVVLEYWPAPAGPAAGRFTTIASWNGLSFIGCIWFT